MPKRGFSYEFVLKKNIDVVESTTYKILIYLVKKGLVNDRFARVYKNEH